MSPRARVTLVTVFLLTAAICARLGVWQLDRLQERRRANAVALGARAAPPVVLGTAQRPPDSAMAQRWVAAAGRYDHAREIVLWGRSFRGVPGVHVVTPLRPARGDTAVLVDRGFVPSPDAVTVELDSLAEPGEQRVAGVAVPIESRPDGGGPLARAGRTTWSRLDLAAARRLVPYPVFPFYIRQTPDSLRRGSQPGPARFPRRLPPPALDDGPHQNYALQWFAFAALGVAFGVVVWFRGR
jgi:surfeit locus 1 family protein